MTPNTSPKIEVEKKEAECDHEGEKSKASEAQLAKQQQERLQQQLRQHLQLQQLQQQIQQQQMQLTNSFLQAAAVAGGTPVNNLNIFPSSMNSFGDGTNVSMNLSNPFASLLKHQQSQYDDGNGNVKEEKSKNENDTNSNSASEDMNMKRGTSMNIKLPPGIEISGLNSTFSPSLLSIGASFLGLASVGNSNVKANDPQNSGNNNKNNKNHNHNQYRGENADGNASANTMNNLDDLLADSTLPESNLNVKGGNCNNIKQPQKTPNDSTNLSMNNNPGDQSLYISGASHIKTESMVMENSGVDSESASQNAAGSALLTLSNSIGAANLNTPLACPDSMLNLSNSSSTGSNSSPNRDLNGTHQDIKSDKGRQRNFPMLNVGSSLSNLAALASTSLGRSPTQEQIDNSRKRPCPSMETKDMSKAKKPVETSYQYQTQEEADKSTGQWSKQEECVLLHLVKGMVSCELKMIAKAAKACRIHRQPRAVDKKLKRLIGFKNWKTRDQKNILSEVYKVIQNKEFYKLSKEREQMVEDAIRKFSSAERRVFEADYSEPAPLMQ